MCRFTDAKFRLTDRITVSVPDLELLPHTLTVITGGNGSGKTSLAAAAAGKLELISGKAPSFKSAVVSFEQQQQLFEDDYNLRNSDTLSAAEEAGITVETLLKDSDPVIKERCLQAFNMQSFLHRPLRTLSGGEGRRALIIRALCENPELLVLDTPFDALDVESRIMLTQTLLYIKNNYDAALLLTVNRSDEIPEFTDRLCLAADMSIIKSGSLQEMMQDEDTKSLLFAEELPDAPLPEAPERLRNTDPLPDPLIELKNIHISYDRPVFEGLNFTVHKGEHCKITGPNGAGKSTLLSLITGDNPLVYTNDVTVFGMKRGSGESIWDIKKHYGLVSGALHLDYRVSSSALQVVLSGFYDSIGLYTQPKGDELRLADEWLKIAGLYEYRNKPFKSLSFGRQRMLLIIRALVKNPPLLILDEPLQGLDACGRALVKSFLSYIIRNGRSTVLFVSHHAEDAPKGLVRQLSFVLRADGKNYDVIQSVIDE